MGAREASGLALHLFRTNSARACFVFSFDQQETRSDGNVTSEPQCDERQHWTHGYRCKLTFREASTMGASEGSGLALRLASYW